MGSSFSKWKFLSSKEQNAKYSWIFHIPDILMIEILTKWCDAKCLRTIDTSFCNKRQRQPYWCSLLSSQAFVIQEHVWRERCLIWIEMKLIKVRNITIYNGSFTGCNKLCFKVNTSQLYVLVIGNCSQHEMTADYLTSLINLCPRLTDLTIDSVKSFDDNVVLNVSPAIWMQLTDLTLNGTVIGDLTSAAVDHLAKKCSRLKNVEIILLESKIDLLAIESLLISNPALRSVMFKFLLNAIDERLIRAIPQCCPLIEDISLFNCSSNISLHMCSGLVKECLHLKYLNIQIGEMDDRKCLRLTNHYNGSNKKCLEIRDFSPRDLTDSLSEFLSSVKDVDDLHLVDVRIIDFNVFRAIVKENKNLQHINLFSCEISHALDGICFIVKNCRQLHTLELAGCHQISDADFQEIFRTPNKIHTFSIHFHNTLTVDTLICILLANVSISKLWCFGCPLVDTNELQKALNKNKLSPRVMLNLKRLE